MQNYGDSIANTLESLQSCTNPSIECWVKYIQQSLVSVVFVTRDISKEVYIYIDIIVPGDISKEIYRDIIISNYYIYMRIKTIMNQIYFSFLVSEESRAVCSEYKQSDHSYNLQLIQVYHNNQILVISNIYFGISPRTITMVTAVSQVC